MKKQISLFLFVVVVLFLWPYQAFANYECPKSIFKKLDSNNDLFTELIKAEKTGDVFQQNLTVTDEGISLTLCESYIDNNKIAYSFQINFEENMQPKYLGYGILNKPVVSINKTDINHSDVIWAEQTSSNEYIGVQIIDLDQKIRGNDQLEILYQTNLGRKGQWELEIPLNSLKKEQYNTLNFNTIFLKL